MPQIWGINSPTINFLLLDANFIKGTNSRLVSHNPENHTSIRIIMLLPHNKRGKANEKINNHKDNAAYMAKIQYEKNPNNNN